MRVEGLPVGPTKRMQILLRVCGSTAFWQHTSSQYVYLESEGGVQ